MAGLWETWINSKTNNILNSYTIITTEANPMMKIIHNKKKRMPVILKEENYENWLTSFNKEISSKLLVSFNESEMEAYTISKLITAKGMNQNVPEVIKPYTYPGVEPHFG